MVSPRNPSSIKIAKDIAKDFPSLDSRTVRKYASYDTLLCIRYAAFAAHCSWSLLTILSFSETFRRAALSLSPDCWSSLLTCVSDNAVSLELFVSVRGLANSNSVLRIAKHIPLDMRMRWLDMQDKAPKIAPVSPCAYIIADKMDLVMQPMFEGFRQVNVRDNIYNPEIFGQGQMPHNWPEGKTWPSDPTLREPGEGICRSCGNQTMCDCEPHTSPVVTHPLVELKDFGSKGRGIRTLQRIEGGDLLAEYVGLIKDADSAMTLSIP